MGQCDCEAEKSRGCTKGRNVKPYLLSTLPSLNILMNSGPGGTSEKVCASFWYSLLLKLAGKNSYFQNGSLCFRHGLKTIMVHIII